jgi:hypothetical protein
VRRVTRLRDCLRASQAIAVEAIYFHTITNMKLNKISPPYSLSYPVSYLSFQQLHAVFRVRKLLHEAQAKHGNHCIRPCTQIAWEPEVSKFQADKLFGPWG